MFFRRCCKVMRSMACFCVVHLRQGLKEGLVAKIVKDIRGRI